MSNKFARLVFAIPGCSRFICFIRRFLAKRNITIVNYHNPPPEIFESHLLYFSRYYKFISMDMLVDCSKNKRMDLLPDYSLIITFDDGHIGNKKLFELFRRHSVPAIIYVVSDLVDTRRSFWWQAPGLTQSDVKFLKAISNCDKISWLKKERNFGLSDELGCVKALTGSDLRLLINSGCFVGSHTVTHPILPMCSKAEQMEEIAHSKEDLERIIGTEIKHFCFPNGAYDIGIKAIVRDAGYFSARTTRPGWVTKRASMFSLPTMGISDDACIEKLSLQISGLWGLLLYLMEFFQIVFAMYKNTVHKGIKKVEVFLAKPK